MAVKTTKAVKAAGDEAQAESQTAEPTVNLAALAARLDALESDNRALREENAQLTDIRDTAQQGSGKTPQESAFVGTPEPPADEVDVYVEGEEDGDADLDPDNLHASLYAADEGDMHDDGLLHGYDPAMDSDLNLHSPPPRPGMKQRWVRMASGGQDDVRNQSKKLRQGWSPRQADTVSKFYAPLRLTQGRFVGGIGVEGMVLCEMPKELYAVRAERIRTKTADMTRAIDADLDKTQRPAQRAGVGGIGPIERTHRSQVTRGRVPNAAD